jgi:hypothetical protein
MTVVAVDVETTGLDGLGAYAVYSVHAARVRAYWNDGPGTEPMRIPDADDPDAAEDPKMMELCEILLCPACAMELEARPCGPSHAYLADHPAEHPLIKEQLHLYLRKMRWTEGTDCTVCSFGKPDGQKVAIATGDCMHADVRDDQVLMSRRAWEKLTREITESRTELARIEDERDERDGTT